LLDDLLMEIAREVLPPRELRCNPRVVKRKMSNFRLKHQEDYHPPKSKPFAEAIVILSNLDVAHLPEEAKPD
jgi:hypothetical protein